MELENGQVVATCPEIEIIADPFLLLAKKLKLSIRR